MILYLFSYLRIFFLFTLFHFAFPVVVFAPFLQDPFTLHLHLHLHSFFLHLQLLFLFPPPVIAGNVQDAHTVIILLIYLNKIFPNSYFQTYGYMRTYPFGFHLTNDLMVT